MVQHGSQDQFDDNLDEHLPFPLEVEQLRTRVQALEQENQDLRISLATIAEHGDLVEAQLCEANLQLREEIQERRKAESILRALVDLISQQKDDLEIIIQTITEHGDVLDVQWLEKLRQAKLLATFDGLTQIANRRRFDEYLEQQWRQMSRELSPISIILCDIDFFKQFNDTYGHLAGDDCLRQIAKAIAQPLKRPSDLLARFGGEEFVIVLPKTGLRGAYHVAKQVQCIVEDLKIPHARSRVRPFVTLSMGIASTLPDLERSPQLLLDAADHRLYQAKQQGRARIVYEEISSPPNQLSSFPSQSFPYLD